MAKKSIPAPQADANAEPQWLSLGDPDGLNFWEREWTQTTIARLRRYENGKRRKGCFRGGGSV